MRILVFSILLTACGGSTETETVTTTESHGSEEPVDPAAIDPADVESSPAPVETTGLATEGEERPRDEIQQVIREHLNEVRYCYERQLHQDPTLSGSLRIQFIIAPDGHILSAAALEPFEPNVDACVLERVRAWTFPPAAGPTQVTYPFVFAT